MAWPCRTPARRVRRQSRTGTSAARIGARGYTTLTNVGEKPSRNVRRTPRVARCHKIVTRFGGLNRLGMAIYGRNETDGSWPRRTRSAGRQVGRSAGRISPAPLPRPAVQCASARATRRHSREPATVRKFDIDFVNISVLEKISPRTIYAALRRSDDERDPDN